MTFKAVPSFITKTLNSRPKKMRFLNEVFSFSYCSSSVFSVVFYTCMIDDICQISFETLGFRFLNLSINHPPQKTIECEQYSSTETQLLLPVFKAKFYGLEHV